MLNRQDVNDLYALLLDRQPESEGVYADDRGGRSAKEVAIEFFGSKEFLDKNRFWISMLLGDR